MQVAFGLLGRQVFSQEETNKETRIDTDKMISADFMMYD
jgi:hypothetical protein